MQNNILKSLLVALSFCALASCENAEYSPVTNMLYIDEAAPASGTDQQVGSIVVKGDVTKAIHARIAQKLDKDVKVRVSLAPELVSAYNTNNGTAYEVVPAELLSFDAESVIQAGKTHSDDINIRITQFRSDVTYVVPLRIDTADPTVQVAQTTSRMMFVLETPLIQKVPMMNYSHTPTWNGDDWGISTKEWTLEAWLWMDSFRINNQAIFNGSVSKGTEIYIRFGDADLDYNKLQIKTGGSQFNSNKSFDTSTWYHLAFVCGNGKVKMYIDGEEDSSMELSDPDYVINKLTLCSSGSTYFRAYAKMAQVRFWKKALSGDVIKKQMNKAVPADSDGLFGYWRLDEGEGTIYHDSTSNAYDLTCSNDPNWETEVDFTAPNTK